MTDYLQWYSEKNLINVTQYMYNRSATVVFITPCRYIGRVCDICDIILEILRGVPVGTGPLSVGARMYKKVFHVGTFMIPGRSMFSG